MNTESFREFVLEHEGDDPSRLMLSRGRWPEVDVNAAVTAIECRRKIRTKLPEWYAEPGIIFPDRICAEQSSSSETANYKATVASGIIREALAANSADISTNANESHEDVIRGRIADLTGGLGVDSLAFSHVAKNVLYNEMNPERAAAAKHNFALLGAANIDVISHCVQPRKLSEISGGTDTEGQASATCSGMPSGISTSEGSVAGVSATLHDDFWDTLTTFRPDLIYMDPARRSITGNKVFLLEDCSPDVLTLLSDLFRISVNLLLKLSPMADISMLITRLREHQGYVHEIHVVAAVGECKELLLWVRPEPCSRPRLFINENGHIIEADETSCDATPKFLHQDQLPTMTSLFEPGKALAKAGLFHAVASLFKVNAYKAGRSTHLFFSPEDLNLDNTPGVEECKGNGFREGLDSIDPNLRNFGKIFKILEVENLNKQTIRDFGRKYPKAEVSARNIPMTSDELRKKLKVASGGDIHIFGIRVDFDNSTSSNYLIAAQR